MTGDFVRAISLLEKSLKTPTGVTVDELRIDPTWDALRGEPSFQMLLQQAGRKIRRTCRSCDCLN